MAIQSQDCALLNLPAELRNTIYSYVFDDTRKAADISRSNPRKHQKKELSAYIPRALLQTCSRIRAEAGSIYYADRVFYVDDYRKAYSKVISSLASWLECLGPQIRSSVRVIVINCWATNSVETGTEMIKVMHQGLADKGIEIAKSTLFVRLNQGYCASAIQDLLSFTDEPEGEIVVFHVDDLWRKDGGDVLAKKNEAWAAKSKKQEQEE